MSDITLDVLAERHKKDKEEIDRRLINIEKLVNGISEIAVEIKYMRQDVENLSERLATIETVPNKRYEAIITAIITCIVGGVIGFLMRGGA